jgi:hypothetical protein
MAAPTERTEKPRRMPPPLSRANQVRLLKRLNMRAHEGDVSAIDALLRLGLLAKEQTQSPA